MKTLGELKKIEPKEVWQHEREFTLWLQNNMRLLATAVGLELDLVEREVPIGDFAADLIAKELNTGRLVIIENQLTPTDHNHLGQLITYAGNRKAAVIIWISPRFRDEHRQALEWLNDVTQDDTDFFGLELELLQINDSVPAPNFTIEAKPSAWKQDRSGEKATARQRAYHDFFTTLLVDLRKKAPRITSAQRVGYESWFALSAGRSGFSYSFSFTQDKRFRVELYIDQGDKNLNEQAFDLLKQEQEAIAEQLGLPIAWERLDTRRACRIAVYRDNSQILSSPEDVAEIRKWAIDIGLKFRQVMSPRIKDLDLGTN